MIAVFRSKIRKGRDGNSALKRKTFICLCGVLLLVGITVIWHKAVNDKTIRNPDVILKHAIKDTQPESTEILRTTQTEKMEKTIEAEKVNVPELSAQREDTGHIKIRWADDLDGLVTGYFIESVLQSEAYGWNQSAQFVFHIICMPHTKSILQHTSLHRTALAETVHHSSIYLLPESGYYAHTCRVHLSETL